MQHWHLHLKYFETLRDVFWMKLPWVISCAAVSWAAAGPRLLMWVLCFPLNKGVSVLMHLLNIFGNNINTIPTTRHYVCTRSATGCRYHLDTAGVATNSATHVILTPLSFILKDYITSYFRITYPSLGPQNTWLAASWDLIINWHLSLAPTAVCTSQYTSLLPVCCRAARWVLLLRWRWRI